MLNVVPVAPRPQPGTRRVTRPASGRVPVLRVVRE